jgi:hypothetical protein
VAPYVHVYRKRVRPTGTLRRRVGCIPATTVFQVQIEIAVDTTVAVLKNVGKAVTQTCTNTATVLKNVGKFVSTTVSGNTTILTPRDVVQLDNATATTLASLTKTANKNVSATATTAVTLMRAIAKNVAITLTTTAIVQRAMAFLVSLGATATATVIKNVAKAVVADAVVTTATISRDIAKNVTAVCTSVVSFFEALLRMTSTEVIQKPVDYVVEWMVPIKDRGIEFEIHSANTRELSTGNMRSEVRRHGKPPSFTTKTSKKGYD